jgi:soluble lytic murein transglycosylase-like protein
VPRRSSFEAGLPISPRFLLSTALLAALAGCSTSGGTLNAALDPQAVKAEQDATAAEAEGVENSLAWETSPATAPVPFAPQARPQAAADAGLPAVVPAGYAGPTPTSGPIAAGIALAASSAIRPPEGRLGPQSVEARSPELDLLIAKYAAHYDVPEALVRRVVNRESTFNPRARNGPYWGLMQILPATARSMGHRGPASELLDAETNLKYAVRYLRGAWLVAGGNHDRAVMHYARGYYYDARNKGMLGVTGLGVDRRRAR